MSDVMLEAHQFLRWMKVNGVSRVEPSCLSTKASQRLWAGLTLC